jgi:hypothetical protein
MHKGLNLLTMIDKIKRIYLRYKWREARGKAEERSLERKKIEKLLKRKFKKEEVERWNLDLIIDSAGWIGGGWTEDDIKRRIWRHNKSLFKGKKYKDMI